MTKRATINWQNGLYLTLNRQRDMPHLHPKKKCDPRVAVVNNKRR